MADLLVVESDGVSDLRDDAGFTTGLREDDAEPEPALRDDAGFAAGLREDDAEPEPALRDDSEPEPAFREEADESGLSDRSDIGFLGAKIDGELMKIGYIYKIRKD